MISWDEYFMMLTYAVAMKSKDKSTKIGAIIVGPDNEVRSMGYNSFPRGINDNLEKRQERPEKYFYFEHAERNAIYNAARMGTSLNGCRMYTQGMPCADCARAVIQSGIKEVIVHKKWNDENLDKWAESAEKSINMFNEAKILVRIWDGKILKIKSLKRDKELDI